MEQNNIEFDFDKLYQTLRNQYYVEVPFPMPHSIILEAVNAFFKFLDEPEAVKTHIDFTIAPLHRRGEVGFRHRDPSEGFYNDSKDFFHYHPEIFKRYGDFLETHPAVKEFMLKAKPIWELAAETVKKILQTFECRFKDAPDKVFKNEPCHILLRFLRYDWQTSGKYLAKPHFDAGSFTLAIAESCAGLRIGSCPENLQAVHHNPGTATFMLSSNFQKVMDTEELSPAWHDVIQVDETLIGKPFARWAIVVFFEAYGVEALPRTKTHQWYTETTAY